jgi:hypothetical protein
MWKKAYFKFFIIFAKPNEPYRMRTSFAHCPKNLFATGRNAFMQGDSSNRITEKLRITSGKGNQNLQLMSSTRSMYQLPHFIQREINFVL